MTETPTTLTTEDVRRVLLDEDAPPLPYAVRGRPEVLDDARRALGERFDAWLESIREAARAEAFDAATQSYPYTPTVLTTAEIERIAHKIQAEHHRGVGSEVLTYEQMLRLGLAELGITVREPLPADCPFVADVLDDKGNSAGNHVVVIGEDRCGETTWIVQGARGSTATMHRPEAEARLTFVRKVDLS